MITSNLMGGLGNFMFQITTTHSLALDNEDISVFDSTTSHRIHGHIDSYKDNILRNVNFGTCDYKHSYAEPDFSYNKIPYIKDSILIGYYQSENYFIHNRDKILEYYSIDDVSRKYIDDKYGDLLNNKTCSLHIRRGDYLNVSHIHPPCNLNYYNEAVKHIDSDVYLVFSDDIEWCKENLKFSNLIHFVDGNPDYIDMWLMSLCDNNIIANSSFSWWGAWLNQNPNKKVIAPKKWFGPSARHNTKDLIPETWKII